METGLVKTQPQNHLPSTTLANLTQTERFYYAMDQQLTIADYELKKVSHPVHGKLLVGESLAKYFIGHVLNEMVYPIVGLKRDNYPSPDLAKMIAAHIVKYYGYITPTEIYTAFELALQGKYLTDLIDRNPLEHFQTMDLKYINDVLRAYVRYRHSEVENTRKKIEVLKRDYEAETRESVVKSDKAVKECIRLAFEDYLLDHREISRYLLLDFIFEFLVDVGQIRYNAKWLNKRFSVIRSRVPNMKKSEAMRLTKNMAIYKWFGTLRDKQNRFKWMDNVSFLSPDVHRNLQLIIDAKRIIEPEATVDPTDVQD